MEAGRANNMKESMLDRLALSQVIHDRYGTLFTQRKDDPVAIQSIYLLWYARFGKSTDTHEILEQITGDFERMREKYQVVIDEEEE